MSDPVIEMRDTIDRLTAWNDKMRGAWDVLSQGGCVTAYHPLEHDAIKVLDAFLLDECRGIEE